MKVRNCIDTKKQRKLIKSTSVSNTQQQTFKKQHQNCEEQACSTLMQESQLNNHAKYYGKTEEQPDAFLRVTPRPQEYSVSSSNFGYQQRSLNKNKTKEELNKNYSHTDSILQQKQKTMRQNIFKNFIKTSQQFRNPLIQPFLAGKQVLSLTQYIIAEPQNFLSTLQHTKNQYHNKYLRVLKQMKNRYNKKINKLKTQNLSNLDKNQHIIQLNAIQNGMQQKNKNLTHHNSHNFHTSKGNSNNNNNMQDESRINKQNLSIDNIKIKQYKQFNKTKSNMMNGGFVKIVKNAQKIKGKQKQFEIERLNIKSQQVGRKNHKKMRNYSMNSSPQKSINTTLNSNGKLLSENKSEKQKSFEKSVFYSHRFSVISHRY